MLKSTSGVKVKTISDCRIALYIPTLHGKSPLDFLTLPACDSPGKVTTWGQARGWGSHLKSCHDVWLPGPPRRKANFAPRSEKLDFMIKDDLDPTLVYIK